MSARYRVISIGTLAAHPLWDERVAVRTGHATSTLIESGDARILVNPGLPPTAMVARMSERTKVPAPEITHVFLTSFASDHRRGLAAFESAQWLVYERERSAAEAELTARLEKAREIEDGELESMYEAELEVLARCLNADDAITPGVDLFPAPGVTPGTCGLLLPLPRSTVLITGDAVATMEHLEDGKVLPGAFDVEQAMESFRECIEIADVVVPGRDNVAYNPLRMVGG